MIEETLLLHLLDLLADGHDHGEHGNQQEDQGDGAGDENGPVAASLHQGLAQVLLRHGAQDEADDHGGGGDLQGLEGQTHQAEHGYAPHVEDAEVGAVGAHHAAHHDDGQQEVLGDVQHLHEQPQTGPLADDHEHVGNEQGDKDAVHILAALLEDQRTGGDAVDGQAAQEDGGGHVARDAHGDQGDQGAADHGVVGGLGGDDAVDDAGSELFGVLGGTLSGGVGQQAGGGAADAGQDADTQADEGGLDNQTPVGQVLLGGDAVALQVVSILGLTVDNVMAVKARADDICDGVQADEDDHGIEAAVQVGLAEGEADGAVHGGDTHQGQGNAEQAGQNAVDQGVAGQAGDDSQSKDRDGEVFSGGEGQGDLGQVGGDEHQGEDAEQAAHKGGQNTDAQGLTGLALIRHGAAVKHGGDGGGGAGDLQQNGGD